jgi:hypothetical protein
VSSPLALNLLLRAGCAETGCLRWQTGAPPPSAATDVSLAGCTAIATVWAPQQWNSPLLTITTTPSADGSISISTFSSAQVPSLVTWLFSAAGVALLLPAVPLDEARLEWGLNIIFPSTGPWPLIRGRVTVKP